MIESIKNIDRITFINYLILFYAFVISFPIEVIRLVAILMILLWLTDRKSEINLPKTRIFLFFGIFLFYISLSYIWSDASLKEAWSYFKRYWYFIPSFIIFKYLKKDNFNLLITSFLSGIFISEVFSYGNFFGFWQIGHGSQIDPTVFMQHSLYGLFLCVVSLFLFFKLLYEERDKYWYINLFFFMTITINIFINSGRTGYFTFLLTLIAVVIFKNIRDIKKLFKYLAISILILSVIFTSAYNLSSNFKYRLFQVKKDIEKIINQNNYNSSVGARIGFWIIAKDILQDHLLLGVGIANQNNVKQKIIKEKYNTGSKSAIYVLEHFHNVHLETISSYGLVGYILLILLLIQILLIKIKDSAIHSLKYILIFSFIFAGLADNVFYLSQPISLFAICLGIILSKYKFENTKTK